MKYANVHQATLKFREKVASIASANVAHTVDMVPKTLGLIPPYQKAEVLRGDCSVAHSDW